MRKGFCRYKELKLSLKWVSIFLTANACMASLALGPLASDFGQPPNYRHLLTQIYVTRPTHAQQRQLVRTSPLAATGVVQEKPTRPPQIPGEIRGPRRTTTGSGSVINFEDYPRGTIITAQYGTRGVVFPNQAFLDTDQAARSGTRVLRAASLVREFHPGPLRIELTRAQSRIRLFAGTSLSTTAISGTLRAFNASGVQVAQDGPKNVAPHAFTTAFEVTASIASIVRVELQMAGEEFEAIDDLELEAPSPGTVPTEAPVVQFTSPANNAEIDLPSVTAQGTVTGDGLLSNAIINWQTPLPPGASGLQQSNTLVLSGTGSSRSFSFLWDYSRTAAPFGPVTITVQAQNSTGLKGTSTVQFTSFPTSIRSRYASSGGAATFGDFQFAIRPSGANCQMAVYERGAIAAEGSTTRIVLGPILTKWLSMRSSNDLGCPADEQETLPGASGLVGFGTRLQDFTRGRIYTGPTGTFYVPLVLVEAIEQAANGITTAMPVEDPAQPLGVKETWLFQRFTSPSMTLEIRGASGMSPKLYMERTQSSATVVEVFPCDGTLGPCNVDRPLKESSLGQQIDPMEPALTRDQLGRYCKNTTWEDKGFPALKRVVAAWATNPFTPLPAAAWATGELIRLSDVLTGQWPAIADDNDPTPSDYDQTPLKGIVTETKRGNEDNPFNHTHYGSCVSGDLCPSDYRLDVIPLRGWRGILGGRDYIHVEWEEWYMRAIYASADESGSFEPMIGDLVFISGRWIVDCGHRWKTEIHPPSIVATMRNRKYEGRDATVANVWVTGWYSGDEPVEFLIHPPPRPSPSAILRLVAPDSSMTDVTVTTTIGSNAVRLRVTAPRRRPKVTGGPWFSQSNMIWLEDPPRTFRGRYWLLWSER